MVKLYTIEDYDGMPFGFFMVEKERDEAYIAHIVKKDRWGIRGELIR